MKKKSLILFICMAMVLAAGCGKDGRTSSDISSTAQVKDEDSDSDKQTTGDLESSSVTAASLYSVTLTHHASQETTGKTSVVLLYNDYDTIEIQGGGYQALSDSVAQWQDQKLEEIEQLTDDYVKAADEDRKNMEEFYGYNLSYDILLKRLDSHILSITNTCNTYLGGAHPSYYTEGINFDAATGELLSLKDIVNDYSGFSAAAVSYILDYLSDSVYADGLYPDYEDMIPDSVENISWYFSADGLVFVYNTYEIAPYAAGTIEIPLPLAEFSGYLKEKYQQREEPGLAAVPFGEPTTVCLDGVSHTISLENSYSTQAPNTFDDNSVTLKLDDTALNMDQYFHWLRNCYVIRQDDRTLLMVDGDMASDDYVTVLLDISDGTIRELSSAYASIDTPGVHTALLGIRVDALGTYSSKIHYDISAGNELQPLETEYIIDSAYQNLITKKELPVTGEDGTESTLPVGTSLLPLATDGKSYIRLMDVDTDKEYTVYFTREEYTIMIDDIEEYEYFEMLPYAG